MPTSYCIVCVDTEHPHRHIVQVGTETDGNATQTWTVKQVRKAIKAGDHFYAVSPSTGQKADVRRSKCRMPNCNVKTIRSKADATPDNNLDNLGTCG
jgi:hypothetical protein